MNRKTRIQLVIGGIAAVGIAAGVRHCLRTMTSPRGLGDALALCQGRAAHGCGAVDDAPEAAGDREHRSGALAA